LSKSKLYTTIVVLIANVRDQTKVWSANRTNKKGCCGCGDRRVEWSWKVVGRGERGNTSDYIDRPAQREQRRQHQNRVWQWQLASDRGLVQMVGLVKLQDVKGQELARRGPLRGMGVVGEGSTRRKFGRVCARPAWLGADAFFCVRVPTPPRCHHSVANKCHRHQEFCLLPVAVLHSSGGILASG
jgi:hypothetical protein